MDAEKCIAAGNRGNGALAAFMRWRNVSTAACLIMHNGTDAIMRHRNVGITEEE